MVTRLVRIAGALKGGPAFELSPEETARAAADEARQESLATVIGNASGAAYDAWRALAAAVTSTMPPRRFELVTLVAARELRSTYCSVAHGAILAEQFIAEQDVVQLAAGDVPEALDDQERVVVAFAAKAALSAADITAGDVEVLRRNGLDDTEIFDVVLATAARCFFSTVLDATGTLADAEFADRISDDLRRALTLGRAIADR